MRRLCGEGATADALLAWLETQTRAGATVAPAKGEGCPEEAASAQDPDGGLATGSVGQDAGVTQPVESAINEYLTKRNAEPRPFVWTASAASVLAKLARLPVAFE